MGMLCGVLALLALPGAVHPQARSDAITAFGMLEMHQGTPAPDVTLLRPARSAPSEGSHGPRKWDGKAARALITSLLPAANGGVAR